MPYREKAGGGIKNRQKLERQSYKVKERSSRHRFREKS